MAPVYAIGNTSNDDIDKGVKYRQHVFEGQRIRVALFARSFERYFLEGEALVKHHADDRENVKLRNARKFQRIPGVLFFFS